MPQPYARTPYRLHRLGPGLNPAPAQTATTPSTETLVQPCAPTNHRHLPLSGPTSTMRQRVRAWRQRSARTWWQATRGGDDHLRQWIGLGEVGALELLPHGIVLGMLYATMH
jgi:hypothetical protein